LAVAEPTGDCGLAEPNAGWGPAGAVPGPGASPVARGPAWALGSAPPCGPPVGLATTCPLCTGTGGALDRPAKDASMFSA
jgi:hypothetical protein